MKFFLILSVLCFSNVVHGAAILSSIGQFIFSEVGSAVGSYVTDSIMEALGFTDTSILEGIQGLEGSISDLEGQIADVYQYLKKQDFQDQMAKTEEKINDIKTMSSKVQDWTHNSPTSNDIKELVDKLQDAISDISTFVSGQAGVVPKAIEFYSGGFSKVTDTNRYWDDIDAFRSYYRDVLAQAFALVEYVSSVAEDLYNEQCPPFSGEPNTACRSSGTDVTVLKLSKEGCKAKCFEDSKCVAVEFNEHERCEIWKSEITHTAAVNGYTCLKKVQETTPDVRLPEMTDEFITTSDGACRGSFLVQNEDPSASTYYQVEEASSLAACKELCKSRGDVCRGFEFGSGRCEIWTVPIVHFKRVSGYSCSRRIPKKIKYTWKQFGESACRGGKNNEGSPTDPNADSYYTIIEENNMRIADCHKKCEEKKGLCLGVEFRENNPRCELWTKQIDFIKPSSGYVCQKLIMDAIAPTGEIATGDCPFRVSSTRLNTIFLEAKNAVRKMYEHGVPLIEARDGKFLHVKDEKWALASPQNSFSGYFITNQHKEMKGHTSYREKMQIIKQNYLPQDHGGSTLEEYLKSKHIPTRSLDYGGWSCSAIGGVSCSQLGCGAVMFATVDYVEGNELKRRSLGVLQTSEGFDASSAQEYCESLIPETRSSYQRPYSINPSTKQPYGGLTTWHDNWCMDSDLCDHPLGLKPDSERTSNHGFVQQYYGLNLKVDDCKRLCENGVTTPCKYCGNRYDVAGRAALKSYHAIEDYAFPSVLAANQQASKASTNGSTNQEKPEPKEKTQNLAIIIGSATSSIFIVAGAAILFLRRGKTKQEMIPKAHELPEL